MLGAKGAIEAMQDDSFKKMAKALVIARKETLITLSGSRSGRTYKVPGTQRTYTASSAEKHEAPAQATGELRQHVSTSIEGNGNTIVGNVGILESAINKVTKSSIGDYAKWLEYGTRNMAPRPWLKLSCERATPEIKRILGAK